MITPIMIKTTLVVALLGVLFTEVAGIKRDRSYNLKYNFYQQTCPQTEKIIGDTVTKAFNANRSVAAALVRLHVHDCFATGCDASIMLDPTKRNPDVEMESPANKRSVFGLEVIDEAKAQLEKECPGIVSCADIIAFAARDGTKRTGFPYFKIKGGRRDGLAFSFANQTFDIPGPGMTVAGMTNLFARKGLNQEELVTLLGAHTIGSAHCSTFRDRLNYLNPGTDRSIDHAYEAELIKICPRPNTTFDMYVNGARVPLDPITPDSFDNSFYKALLQKKGLLRSDQALMYYPETSALVKELAANPDKWIANFKHAFGKVGKIDVLTGRHGEIRRNCRFVN